MRRRYRARRPRVCRLDAAHGSRPPAAGVGAPRRRRRGPGAGRSRRRAVGRRRGRRPRRCPAPRGLPPCAPGLGLPGPHRPRDGPGRCRPPHPGRRGAAARLRPAGGDRGVRRRRERGDRHRRRSVLPLAVPRRRRPRPGRRPGARGGGVPLQRRGGRPQAGRRRSTRAVARGRMVGGPVRRPALGHRRARAGPGAARRGAGRLLRRGRVRARAGRPLHRARGVRRRVRSRCRHARLLLARPTGGGSGDRRPRRARASPRGRRRRRPRSGAAPPGARPADVDLECAPPVDRAGRARRAVRRGGRLLPPPPAHGRTLAHRRLDVQPRTSRRGARGPAAGAGGAGRERRRDPRAAVPRERTRVGVRRDHPPRAGTGSCSLRPRPHRGRHCRRATAQRARPRVGRDARARRDRAPRSAVRTRRGRRHHGALARGRRPPPRLHVGVALRRTRRACAGPTRVRAGRAAAHRHARRGRPSRAAWW